MDVSYIAYCYFQIIFNFLQLIPILCLTSALETEDN